jgi:hypothetical protein
VKLSLGKGNPHKKAQTLIGLANNKTTKQIVIADAPKDIGRAATKSRCPNGEGSRGRSDGGAALVRQGVET